MFQGASNLSAGVDRALIFIFVVAAVFIVGITVFMIWVAIKYNRKKNKPAKQFTGNNWLEIIWTVIPTILVLIMFYYGWVGFAPMRKPPPDAMEVTAIGRMWEWEFDYGKGKLSKELVLPVDKPVKLNLVSEDVNHSLFIPAFRVKEDVVPGYDNFLWFTPTYIGNYEILCTEYCGLLHSAMIANSRVISENEFITWLDTLPAIGDIPDPEGLVLLKNNGCLACHSLTGVNLVGPTFKGSFGSQQIVIEDNQEKQITVDEAYLKESIYEPNKQIVKGYSRGLMQSYKMKITDAEIAIMADYLETIGKDQ